MTKQIRHNCYTSYNKAIELNTEMSFSNSPYTPHRMSGDFGVSVVNTPRSVKVQGRLVQARFIEIHQVFAKKKSDTFLTYFYYLFIHRRPIQ